MSLCLFGYGSLIWKADFPYVRKLNGFIVGYERRFYQASTDHRGVPEKPGRVVTLLCSDDPEAKVYGVVYEIVEEKRLDVEKYLDFREKCGYSKVEVNFFPYNKGESSNGSTAPIKAVTYIGTPSNEWFLGPSTFTEMADQIANSKGPSGPNAEYLFNLASSVRSIAPADYEDEHLYTLERLVKEIVKKVNS